MFPKELFYKQTQKGEVMELPRMMFMIILLGAFCQTQYKRCLNRTMVCSLGADINSEFDSNNSSELRSWLTRYISLLSQFWIKSDLFLYLLSLLYNIYRVIDCVCRNVT